MLTQRGPLLLAAVSSGGEPASALRRRLDLLHGQVDTIQVFERAVLRGCSWVRIMMFIS